MRTFPNCQRNNVFPCPTTHGDATPGLLLVVARTQGKRYTHFGCLKSDQKVTVASRKFGFPYCKYLKNFLIFQLSHSPLYLYRRLPLRNSVALLFTQACRGICDRLAQQTPHKDISWPASDSQRACGRRFTLRLTGAGRSLSCCTHHLSSSKTPSAHPSHSTSPTSTMCASVHERTVADRRGRNIRIRGYSIHREAV